MFVSDSGEKAVVFFSEILPSNKKYEIHTVISTVGRNIKDISVTVGRNIKDISVVVYSRFPS